MERCLFSTAVNLSIAFILKLLKAQFLRFCSRFCWSPFDKDMSSATTTATTTAAPSEPMDQVVWQRHLPEEVLHTILAWLPIRSYCRLRSVCKDWNAAVKSPSFRSICARVPSPPPFWIVFAFDGPLVFDSTSSSWFVASCFLSYRSVTREAILEAAGSLLFYRNFDPHDRLMFVFNPMSKHKRRIPAMIKMDHCYVMGMVFDQATRSYKIFAVDQSFREYPSGPDILKLQLYDSIQKRWEMTGSLLRNPEDGHSSRLLDRYEVQGAAFCNGALYCLTEVFRDDEVFENDELGGRQPVLARSYHVYRVGPVAWEELKARIPAGLAFPRLFENRGRLLLGGGIADWIVLLSVHLWQFDEARMEWVEILRMPDELVKELATSYPIVLVANGDYIGVGSGHQRRILRYMCDLTKGAWWPLPSEYGHIPVHYLEGVTSSGSLLFEPRVDVVFDSNTPQNSCTASYCSSSSSSSASSAYTSDSFVTCI